ncbi:MAG: hydroxymethylglutaryl-CoA reductase [Anaerolineae bacterium]|nr:hydroxymethylglutaryl-CoA reductase [Anaerolineae bacterium]
MATIPPILLRKLYVPNSLRNQGEQFSFQLRNQIAPGTLVGLSRLMVNGEDRPLDGVTLTTEGGTRRACGLSDDAPLAFEVGEQVTVSVPGTLAAGEHTIQITVQTREVGPLTFPVMDSVA